MTGKVDLLVDQSVFRLWWVVGVRKLLDPGEVIKSRSWIAPRQVGVTRSRQVRQVSKRGGPTSSREQACGRPDFFSLGVKVKRASRLGAAWCFSISQGMVLLGKRNEVEGGPGRCK